MAVIHRVIMRPRQRYMMLKVLRLTGGGSTTSYKVGSHFLSLPSGPLLSNGPYDHHHLPSPSKVGHLTRVKD